MWVDQTMQANFDFKMPLVVVAGHWNTAILDEPGWIARNLQGTPEGEETELGGVVIGDQLGPNQFFPQKRVWLFDGYGLGCAEQRIEFYTLDVEKFETIYSCVEKLVNLLPHTPISAVGVNFKVRVADEIQDLARMLETDEFLESFGLVNSQVRNEKIDLKDEDRIREDGSGVYYTILNLSRSVNGKAAEINFNYHTLVDSTKALSAYSGACPISHWYTHAKRVLDKVYSLGTTENSYF